MWAEGDYPAVVEQVIQALGPRVVAAAGITAGESVLDIAAGSGNVSLPAARTGAHVVATDLTPELLDTGRALAQAQGVDLEWRVADAEALPFDDNAFDVVVSCVGIMFAPHHQAAADELIRVLRPGGRFALLNWTPSGFIGRMFATRKPYVTAPPAGVQPPPLWGSEDHVRALLGDRVRDLTFETAELPVDRFTTGAEFRDFFKASYGPTVVAYRGLSDSSERASELDHALAPLGDQALTDGVMTYEFLLVTGTKGGEQT
jgi:ubiquinone/menaquinone biosynthesis C-methylase UbiE